jgi:hypothetical protein
MVKYYETRKHPERKHLMFCAKCGTQIETNSNFCQQCGTPVNQPVMVFPPNTAMTSYPYPNQPLTIVRTNGMAVASLVLGITGLIPFFYLVPAILAIIFGAVSIGQINHSNGAYRGKGMAVAGLVLGIVSIAFWVLIIIWVGISTFWFSETSNGIGGSIY